jgi:hypothetical protein
VKRIRVAQPARTNKSVAEFVGNYTAPEDAWMQVQKMQV